MLRRRRNTIKWTEPPCFRKRVCLHVLRRHRNEAVRCTIYLLIAAAAVHLIFVRYQLPLEAPYWVIYLMALFVPLPIVLACILASILPSTVRLHPKHLILDRLDTNERIHYASILRYRLGTMRREQPIRYVAFRMFDRPRSIIVGVGPSVDLTELDRKLRARIRLWNRKSRKE